MSKSFGFSLRVRRPVGGWEGRGRHTSGYETPPVTGVGEEGRWDEVTQPTETRSLRLYNSSLSLTHENVYT